MISGMMEIIETVVEITTKIINIGFLLLFVGIVGIVGYFYPTYFKERILFFVAMSLIGSLIVIVESLRIWLRIRALRRS